MNASFGSYRETGTAAGSFFGYRFKTGPLYAPLLVVVEYPDDKERMISFAVQEAGMSIRYSDDFNVESGVYTGGTCPLTDRMYRHSVFLWPSHPWPALICFNQQPGTPAACSRRIRRS